MRLIQIVIWITVLSGIVALAAILSALLHIDAPPRSLGPYLEKRAAGHRPFVSRTGAWLNRILTEIDRGPPPAYMLSGLTIGAHRREAKAQTPQSETSIIFVRTAAEATTAITHARPGDVITFLPGSYRFRGRGIVVQNAGREDKHITVRAEVLDTVVLEFEMIEGFAISAPYWTFENLSIRGVCASHADCEHAFHIVGKGTHFIARNNRIEDFNAHFKINGDEAGFPDYGIIENNSLSNGSIRNTSNPVTPIDLVTASGWVIRANLISDFAKAWGDQTSYGAFAKGAGSHNLFERNIILCEHRLLTRPGRRVGLSLGGGGTEKAFCRDGRCITEQEQSTIQSNLIAFCSDDGIYINRSATSKVLNNSLIDTAGIAVRFAESGADVEGNLVDGPIRSRDGAVIRDLGNLDTGILSLYAGRHPIKGLYRDPLALDLQWKDSVPRRPLSDSANIDLCGQHRPERPAYGAFEQFRACLKPVQP